MKKGAAIINTTSVTAYKCSPHLLDYSSTKGAITAFTRSLSQGLADKGIRVNGVATFRSVALASPRKLHRALCFLHLTILRT